MPRNPLPVLLFASTLLTVSSLPLLGQSPGPEQPVSAPAAGPADHMQVNPVVATDGEVFLVAWNQYYSGKPEVYAARVSRSGELLDQISFPVAIKPDYGSKPRVAWTGRVFLVMYGPIAKRISTQGVVLGEVALPAGELKSLTCNPSRCLAVHQRTTNQTRLLRGTLLNSDGELLISDFEISSHDGTEQVSFVSSATNGSNFLVASYLSDLNSTERQAIHVRTVTNSGAVSSSKKIASGRHGLGFQRVATDGTGYLLVWPEGDVNFRVQARRFNASGNLSGDAMSLLSGGRFDDEVRLVPWGSGHLLVLLSFGPARLEAYPLSSAGSKVDGNPVASWPTQTATSFDAASDGGKALVVWGSARATSDSIQGALLDSVTLQSGEQVVVSQGARAQYRPAAALGGDSVLAVWEEHFPGHISRVLGAFLGDPSPGPELVMTPEFNHASAPSLAFDGSNFMLTWTEGSDPENQFAPRRVMARKLGKQGELLGEAVTVAEGSCADSKVAASGDGFLVTWAECEGDWQLHGVLLDRNGVVLSQFPVSPPGLFIRPGGIAWGGDHFLVSWLETHPAPFPSPCDPVACQSFVAGSARITRDGVPLGSIRFTDSVSSATPQVAFDGARFLLTFQQRDDIVAVRISPDGSSESPRRFADRRVGGALTWDGSAFVAVGIHRDDPPMGNLDLVIARVTHAQLNSGEGAPAFGVIETHDDESAPFVLATSPRRVAIVYQRAAHEREYAGANRVFVREVAFPPRGRAVRH